MYITGILLQESPRSLFFIVSRVHQQWIRSRILFSSGCNAGSSVPHRNITKQTSFAVAQNEIITNSPVD